MAKNISFSQNQLIEPHAALLTKPPAGTLLYKIISSENFFNMLENSYLYFRRVDTYKDDKRDSDQPDKDKEVSFMGKFESAPHITAMHHYASCRSRTYACCFSTEDTSHLWSHYAKNGSNAVCLIFDCHKLINCLNSFFDKARLTYGSQILQNRFYINYGLVVYGDFDSFYLKVGAPSPNPIEYVYFKNAGTYEKEKEFRISLSCIPGLSEDVKFNFSESIHFDFDFVKAVDLKVLKKIKLSKMCEASFEASLKIKLEKIFSPQQVAELFD